jgi:hypothetical protein
MEADTQASLDAQVNETSEPRPRVRSDVGFDAKLAPTCMVWSMVVVLGFLILTMVIWGVQNFDLVFK